MKWNRYKRNVENKKIEKSRGLHTYNVS